MFSFNELTCILKPYFKIDKRRFDCLIQILMALITVRTVNLVEIGQAMLTGGTFEARYKRIKRFFKTWSAFSFATLSKFIAAFFLPSDMKWQLSMDRTHWQWGKKNINILMLSVVCGTVAIPLVWKFLDKKGNSNLQERIELIEDFIRIFGHSIIEELVADREFVGEGWFKWLQEKKIQFIIRVKKNIITNNSKEKAVHARRLFINLKLGQIRVLTKRRDFLGIFLWLAATRAEEGGWVIVATTHEPEYALMRYKKRWAIETLFGFLKSKGFNFEDTHITFYDRLHNLLSVLVIAFCLAYKAGQIISRIIPIKNKKHGRLEKSVFRVGLDVLRQLFFKEERTITSFPRKLTPYFMRNSLIAVIFSGG